MKEKDLLLKALNALYLELDKEIVYDLIKIAEDYIMAVEKNEGYCEGEPCTCTPRVIKVEPNQPKR